MAEPLLWDHEAAALLRVQPDTLRRWRMRGDGPPFVRYGRSIRYRAADVDAWIKDHRAHNAAEARERAAAGGA